MGAIGESEKALDAALAVCIQLEAAAQNRGGRIGEAGLERFGAAWALLVMRNLINEDERDSFDYALRMPGIERHSLDGGTLDADGRFIYRGEV
jgi:hypothetical protein